MDSQDLAVFMNNHMIADELVIQGIITYGMGAIALEYYSFSIRRVKSALYKTFSINLVYLVTWIHKWELAHHWF